MYYKLQVPFTQNDINQVCGSTGNQGNNGGNGANTLQAAGAYALLLVSLIVAVVFWDL